MRIALVSPYSWTLPGRSHPPHRGARRAVHGRTATTCACSRPFDPADRLSARLHRGARPQARELPDWARPAGAHDRRPGQRRRLEPPAHAVRVTTLRRELRAGRLRRRPHPRAGRARRGLGRARHASALPLVGTFHCYSENVVSNGDRQRLRAPSASSSACTCASPSPRPPPGPAGASTAARYRIIPNGVDLPAELPRARAAARGRAAADRLRRPGRRAQGAARPAARLRGAARPRRRRAHARRRDRDEVAPLLLDGTRGVNVAGQGLRRREGAGAGRGRPARARRRWAARASAWC